MKKNIKITSLVLAASMIIAAVAVTVSAKTVFQEDGYSYSVLSSYKASICGWDDRASDLIIPKEIGGRYVAEIDDLSFKDDNLITSVDLTPAFLLERIGSYAFSGCSDLGGTVIISGKVKSIGESAFEGCSTLDSVLIYTDSLAAIPAQCFNECTSLSQVLLPESLTRIEKFAFADCASLEAITIPRSVTSIASTAFMNNDNLVIHCYTDSYAQSFAESLGFRYILIDAPGPSEPVTEPVTDVTEETQPASDATEPASQPATDSTEPETQEPTLPDGSYILGDADGSGFVDIVDATFVQRHVTGLSVPVDEATLMHGNVDGSEELDAVDATFIMRYIVHIRTPYNIGEVIS